MTLYVPPFRRPLLLTDNDENDKYRIKRRKAFTDQGFGSKNPTSSYRIFRVTFIARHTEYTHTKLHSFLCKYIYQERWR